MWVTWNITKFDVTVQGSKIQERRKREWQGCLKDERRYREQREPWENCVQFSAHSRLGHWTRKSSLNGQPEAGVVGQEEQALSLRWQHSEGLSPDRGRIQSMLSTGGQHTPLWTTVGPIESLLSSHPSSEVTASP